MVGCDESKATASARSGAVGRGRVPGCEAPPPAGTSGQETGAPRSPESGRRCRFADVGRHSTSAGPESAVGHPAAKVRACSAEGLQRSRSRATLASSWRRRAVSRAATADLVRRPPLRTGTNRELSESGVSDAGEGAARPPVIALRPAGGVTSRRQRKGQTTTRRRDARPVRSGGRRGQILGAKARPSQAAALRRNPAGGPKGWLDRPAGTSAVAAATPTTERYGRALTRSALVTSADSRHE